MGKKASSASHPGVFNRFARSRCVRTRSAVERKEWAWTDSAMSGCGVGRRPVRTHRLRLCTHPRGGMCQSPCPMRTCRNAWADACRAARPIPVSQWHASPSAAAHALWQMRLEQRDIAVLSADLDDPLLFLHCPTKAQISIIINKSSNTSNFTFLLIAGCQQAAIAWTSLVQCHKFGTALRFFNGNTHCVSHTLRD